MAMMNPMNFESLRRRAMLSWPQVVVLLLVIVSLAVVVDFNRRAQVGETVGLGEADLQTQVTAEMTRQVELQATLTYVQSDEYVAAYARNEGGYILPGEKRIVPLTIDAPLGIPTPVPPPPDPALSARPWQAWWQLLTDAPLPERE